MVSLSIQTPYAVIGEESSMRPTFILDWRDLPVPGLGGTSALRSSKWIEWRQRVVLAD